MAKTQLFRSLRRLIQASLGRFDAAPRCLERRHFLKTSLSVGCGAVAWGACQTRQFKATEEWSHSLEAPLLSASGWSQQIEDIVILGAGLAGLTAAYTLQKEGLVPRVIEASPRVGGRVFTQHNVNAENAFFERGAEFIDSNHSQIQELAKELGLFVQELPSLPSNSQENLYFYKNHVYTDSDFMAELNSVMPKILADLQKTSPVGHVDSTPTYKDVFGAADLDATPMGQYVSSLGLSEWCVAMLETAYVGEMGADWSEQSALNFILLFDRRLDDGFQMFGESDESRRILGGNGQLCYRLSQVITRPHSNRSAPPVHLHVGWRLVAIQDAGLRLRLVFQSGHSPSSRREILASHVICTVPFSVFREVEGWDKLDFSPAKKRAISSLRYGTNTKAFLGFHEAFWRSEDRTAGAGLPPPSSGSLYFPGTQGQVWDTGRGQVAVKKGIMTHFTGGKLGKNYDNNNFNSMISAIKSHYKSRAVSDTSAKALIHNWSQEPTVRGSYAVWGPGDYASIVGCIGEPELQNRLLFAGEHASLNFQGFMNGAVETGQGAALHIIEQKRGLR